MVSNDRPSTIHTGLKHLFDAGRSLITVQTSEEDRLQKLLEQAAAYYNLPLWQWQATRGLNTGDLQQETQDPERCLSFLAASKEPALVWLKDFHHHYTPTLVRYLRDLYYQWRDQGGFILISACERVVPRDIEREMGFLILDMPGHEELMQLGQAWLDSDGQAYKAHIEARVIAGTMKGLTLSEVQHALNRVSIQKPPLDQALLILQDEKRTLIQKSGTLDFIPNVPKLEEVGGLENLKEWLIERKELMFLQGEEARELTPKGLMLMGISGCGKSLCIKSISAGWQLPLYRLDMSRVFSGAFGSPESAFSESCRLMEEMAPAILWIDEIEMGLCADGSTAADATLSRIFAFFLTWMQEKPPGLFVAATANRIDLLPAEMIRKGRFDQVFFVDLPTMAEREAIFRIHLERRGYDPEKFTLEVFVDASEGWNGAEIEQCVVSAVTAARMDGRELELKDMYAARKGIVPISTTMEEQVRHIRNWAYERAVRASRES